MPEAYDYPAALSRLFASRSEDAAKKGEFRFFLKVDVSGIQDYIFHVQSERAARTLKGRSFFVHTLGLLIEAQIRDQVTGACYTLYNGGGNLYLLLESEPDRAALQAAIDGELRYTQLYACVSIVPYTQDFPGDRIELEAASSADKLRKYPNDFAAFEPFDFEPHRTTNDTWSDLTGRLIQRSGFSIQPRTATGLNIGKDSIELLAQRLTLDAQQRQFADSILNKLPTWKGTTPDDPVRRKTLRDAQIGDPGKEINDRDIREFSGLAFAAEHRTGTPRLGVLKMDVDNLGLVFNDSPDLASAKQLSDAFSWFFDQRFRELWEEEFTYQKFGRGANATPLTARYADNLYVVYAGGDDCFVIGAWDAILYFADRLEHEFAQFIAALQSEQSHLQNKKITLSAGIVIVNRKFPALRFAREAEAALEAAKTVDKAKHRVNLFGESLTWKEFRKAATQAGEIAGMIRDGYYQRSLIQRIKQSAQGYEKLQERAKDGQLTAPKVWRLYHFLGKTKNRRAKSNDEERARQRLAEFMQHYATGLMQAFHDKRGSSHMVYPIAARWAEFLTNQANSTSDE